MSRLTGCASTASVIGLLLSSTGASAISLQDYVSDVVEHHPEVRQQIHAYRQIAQDYEIAHKGWRPTVDLTASTGLYSTKSPSTSQQRRDYGSSNLALTLTQNLFSGYDTTYQIEQNEARLASSVNRIHDTADNVALDATRAYLEALKQKQLLDLAVKNVAAHELIYAQVAERNNAGMGLRSEVEQTAGRLAQAHASLIAQQNNLQDALTTLSKFLGRNVRATELEEPQLPAVPEQSLAVLTDQALQQHPAMESARFNILAAQAEHQRAKSADYPQLDLQVRGEVGENLNALTGDSQEYSISLNLRYNLYNGGADKANKGKAVSRIYELNEYANQVRRDIIETLRLSWAANKTLQQQQRYLDEHVRMAEKTATSYKEEFLIGQRDLIDLLDAENELNSAQQSLARADHDRLAAVYRINEGYGQLFQALGINVTLSKDDIRLQSLSAKQQDQLPLDGDTDTDRQDIWRDQCDNSVAGTVDAYGCERQPTLDLGYTPPTKPQPVVAAPKPEIIPDGTPHIEPITFLFDSVEMTAESQARIDAVIEAIKDFPEADVQIYAHTDAIGTEEYNLLLSDRRARAIRDRLIDAGIAADKVQASGKGEAEPIADNGTRSGRQQNRRAEFRVTLPKP